MPPVITSTLDDCLQRIQTTLGLAPRDKPHHSQLPRASVLVLLFPGRRPGHDDDGRNATNNATTSTTQQLHTLITKRSMQLRSHPGECCFPGGRQDKVDEKDDIRTALREAREEIGLVPSHVTILGRLPTVESVNHLCVTPIVALLKVGPNGDDNVNNIVTSYPWQVNADEVDAVFSVPLSFFLNDPDSMFEVEWSGEIFAMRSYSYQDANSGTSFAITGLTAHIAHEISAIAYQHEERSTGSSCSRNEPSSIPTLKMSSSVTQDNSATTISGYLWKREMSSRGRMYWTRRFFVFQSDNNSASQSTVSRRQSFMLHQYDSQEQANRKSQSANKKNRLPLENCQVIIPENDNATALQQQQQVGSGSPSNNNQKYEFSLDAVGGRIQWHLAAATHEDREQWLTLLLDKGQALDRKRKL